jgi:hypothetical protein
MAHKGQARFQDDRMVSVSAFCPSCWFKLESQFFPTVTEWAVRRFFKQQHATTPSGMENPCKLAPRVPRYDNPAAPNP